MKLITILLLALSLAACSRQVELMAAMPEGEANEVMAALQNAGIEAIKKPGKEGMVGLSINAADLSRSVDLLRSKGLPQQRHAGMGQVFKKEGLISSPLEERARYLYALSQELGATLSQIDGVVLARVHVVLPERPAAGETVGTPSSAAVFIKHQENYNLDVLQPQIRRLVNNAIPGLTPDKISIVLFSSEPPRKAAVPRDTTPSATLVATLAALLAAVLAAAGYGVWRYLRSRNTVADMRTEVAP